MTIRTVFFFIWLFACSCLNAQVLSPEQFLGYKIGTRFTPHWKIVDYFKSIAAALPASVKLEPYGRTMEGRPLMVAFISAPTHISDLENIRSGNLALAQMGQKGNSNTSKMPVIVWLSYNVHGNEASSSEASMLTLYALCDPNNKMVAQWLQNTVVVIDPCINPDGRDRYVNWFNSIAGAGYNPSLEAREHREPWPGGRVNHYNFDLNRDWAWQTQIETQQRLALYNNWLPQIHVDFHEQGINNPYYFAPAAEPYHEVITKWQREFQNIIGRNHARYFDQKGWLYFTKERFDLLYPSYGDTYPIYNGAIGMTYEQGGGAAGGLGVSISNGDTLTLVDRANHHFTTSLSTIEIASQNASRLLTEFQVFFKEASTRGVGKYKTYIIKHRPEDKERIASLQDLLQKNKISYGFGNSGPIKGFNYQSGKEESIAVSSNDMLISALQPKSALLKVLFEPNAVLTDSSTYDITAWSLPYAYGLKAFATVQALEVTRENSAKPPLVNPTEDVYGYVASWNGMPTVKLISQLLQKGIKLRFTQTPFETGGTRFERGSIIILKTSNQYVPELMHLVRGIADQFRVTLTPVRSGFVDKGYDFGSSKIRPLKPRRVAMITGEGTSATGAGEIWFYFDQIINYPITLINAADMARINWNNYEVLIMPDGAYKYLTDKAGADQIKTWVNGGGNIIAIEGAVAQLAKMDWGIKSRKTDDSEARQHYELLKTFENREREAIGTTTPGSIFRVELDNTHPLAFGYPNYYYTLKQDENIYDFLKEGGWNVGVIKKQKQTAGFVGSKLVNRLQDGLIFGVQDMGKGSITYLGDDVLFRSFWENGKLLFANAIFLVGQ
ncbi:MAG: M14 family metallopeptidase [Flavisolibacter sp.]